MVWHSFLFNVATCQDTFTKEENVKSDGGVKQSGVTTESDCETKCIDDTACVGYDWNRDDSSCWFHDNVATMIANKQSDSNVDQYRRDGCSGGKLAHVYLKHDVEN